MKSAALWEVDSVDSIDHRKVQPVDIKKRNGELAMVC